MIAWLALLELGIGTRAWCACLQRGCRLVAFCLLIASPAIAALPTPWSAQPRWERPVLFGGGTSTVEIIFRNQSDTQSTVRVGCRWLRVAGSIAAPLPYKETWWTIGGDAGAALLESFPLTVPSVESPTPHLLQWFDESGRVLGTIPVSIIPTTLLAGMDFSIWTNSAAANPKARLDEEDSKEFRLGSKRIRLVPQGVSKTEFESARSYASAGGIVLELAGATVPACWIQTLQCGLWIRLPILRPDQLNQDPAMQLVLMEAIDSWNRRFRSPDCATAW